MADLEYKIPVVSADIVHWAAREGIFMSKNAYPQFVVEGLGILVPMPDRLIISRS